MWEIHNFKIKTVPLIINRSGTFTIVICMSKYDTAIDDSDVFLSLSSSGYMSSIAEWNDVLFHIHIQSFNSWL